MTTVAPDERRSWRGPRLDAVLRRLAVVLASTIAMLFAVEAVLVRSGADFEPMRSRPNANVTLERSEFRVRVQTDAAGFRETRLPRRAAAGTTRIVALGDSFTQGYGVEASEGYTQRLETLLSQRYARPFEVVNLGIPGASPADYLFHLRSTGLAYAPSVVLIGVMGNDVNDARALREQGARGVLGTLRAVRARRADPRPLWKRLPRELWPVLYDLAGNTLAHVGTSTASAGPLDGGEASAPSHPVLDDVQWRGALLELAERYGQRERVAARLATMGAIDEAALRDVVTGHWEAEDEVDQTPLLRLVALIEPEVYVDGVLLPPSYDDAWADTAASLIETVRRARDAGALPVIVYMPAVQQVMPAERAVLEAHGFAWDDRLLTDTTLPDRLAVLAAAHDTAFVDLLAPLREAARTSRPYYLEDGHWTPAGHELAARVLARAMPLP